MRFRAGVIPTSLALLLTLLPVAPVAAAPTLAQVQAQVIRLEEEATSAAEGAQEAKVKLASLT
ncbi:MAG: peptidoglycan endopeptidase, partial [Candidatus Planktophila sp.]